MKALLLVSELEDYTISFASGVAQHLNVVLAVPRRRYAHLASSIDPAVDLHLLDWPRHRSLSNPWFLYQLTRLIRRERPNLIHLLSNSTLWLNLAVPFWRPIPLVTTIHGSSSLLESVFEFCMWRSKPTSLASVFSDFICVSSTLTISSRSISISVRTCSRSALVGERGI